VTGVKRHVDQVAGGGQQQHRCEQRGEQRRPG
jgi:hypothetical protein